MTLTLCLRQTGKGKKNKLVGRKAYDSKKGAGTLYKSVKRDGKFLVLVVDGIFDTPLMELPTEELADKVAFALQSAWEEGIEWGSNQKQSDLLGTGGDTEITSNLQKLQAMSSEERDAYHQRVDRRNERIEKVAEARRWRNVLSWNKHNEE